MAVHVVPPGASELPEPFPKPVEVFGVVRSVERVEVRERFEDGRMLVVVGMLEARALQEPQAIRSRRVAVWPWSVRARVMADRLD